MTLHFFIVLSFTLLTCSTKSQVSIDTVYVGTVTGKTAKEFSKPNFGLTKTLGLPDIKDSKNKIEIRLYETYFLTGLTYCTTVYFDTAFKINRTKYLRYGDSTKHQPKETNPIDNAKPEEIFKALINNGVFSLPDKSLRDIFKESNTKELTSKGLAETGIIIVADGVGYTLEYKVDNLYDRIKFSNPDTYLKAFPDNQIFRRQNEIAKVLAAGFD